MTKILITGVSGSGGSYLAESLLHLAPNPDIHGISRWHSTSANKNLEGVREKIHLHECDLSDLSSVIRTLDLVKPDYVFHIASHANVRASFDTPLAVIQNNVMGTANLLEGFRVLSQNPVIQFCSTSEVYGKVKVVPITEDAPLLPASPYAASKVTQDLLGYVYFVSYGMKIVRTRMFTYLNPRRADLFATAFALQVARIEAGLQKELLHGNLDSTRTFIDVRDAMEAYWLAAQKGVPGEAYNIGGTTTKTVGEFLDILKSKSKVAIPSRQDPKLLRPADVTMQIPDTSKFQKATGWKPRHSFEESVDHLLGECRKTVSNSNQ